MPVSNNLLLAVRTKKTSKVDLKGPITKYIQRVYGPDLAHDAEDDLEVIQGIRNEIVGAASSTVGLGLEKFAKYYRALTAVETRFPISTDTTQVSISFTWWDSFKDHLKATQKNIHFEKAAILFCLVSITSQRGIEAVRTTEEGMKAAVEEFCFSAGILQHLKDNVTIKTEQPRPIDISGECCNMLERLMLTQGQEVFYEISSFKKFSPALCARIAKQVSVMYYEVNGHFNKPQLSSHFDKSWTNICRTKAIMYEAEALLQQAFAHHQDKDHGKYLARLRAALNVLESNRRDIKHASSELQGHCKAVEDKIRSNMLTAEEDNIKVYMDIVPDSSTLPPVQPQLLVKSKLPPYLTDGPEHWFSSIVPDRVAKCLSRYTEMMDDCVRTLLQKLEGATDNARLVVAKHDLPNALDALNPSKKTVPEDVRAAMNDSFVTSGGALRLDALTRNVAEVRGAVEADLARCAMKLDEEKVADEAMRAKMGPQWHRPTSNVLAGPLRETIARYEANLKSARESDGRVLQKVEANRDRMAALSLDQVSARIPSLEAPLVFTGCSDPGTVVTNIRQALGALASLGQERSSIEERIKEARDKDNILPVLMNKGTDDAEAIFKNSLEKYTVHTSAVDTNLARQAEILDVITQNYMAFKNVYDVEGWRIKCEAAGNEIKNDVATGRDMMSNLKEGVQFYTGLQDAVSKLNQMCADFAMTRSIQLEELADDIARKQARNPGHKLLSFVADQLTGGAHSQAQSESDALTAKRMQEDLEKAGLTKDMHNVNLSQPQVPPPQPWSPYPPAQHQQQQQPPPPQGNFSPYPSGQQGQNPNQQNTAPYGAYPRQPDAYGQYAVPQGHQPYGQYPSYQQPRGADPNQVPVPYAQAYPQANNPGHVAYPTPSGSYYTATPPGPPGQGSYAPGGPPNSHYPQNP